MLIRVRNITIGVSLLIFAGACSSGPKIQEFATTANAGDEVQRFAADMQSAAEQQMDVLAPSSYEQASKALKSALSDQQKGDEAKEILHSIAVGRAHLDRAKRSAALSHSNMEEVVVARQAAITAGAPKAFANDFNQANEHLRSVTSRIEDNDLGDVAENRSALQKEYLDVELKAIKLTNLGPARATIATAVKEGAEEFAKQSLAIAEKSVLDTEAYIVANRHQTDVVKSRSDAATNDANHLLKITRASKAGKNISSEETALLIEKEQLKTKDQSEKLSQERKTSRGLAAETVELKSDQAFNKSFESARAEFTGKEAEVYRQGDRLVIRLRSLEFPVNQSVLRGSNFPLLAKVAKVVKGFENPTVAIEGHTDSNGGKAMNKKLSTDRAQAISEYLITSEAIGREKITVAGFGFERPLAPNKTAKGQAQNRRVDVIISPQSAGG